MYKCEHCELTYQTKSGRCKHIREKHAQLKKPRGRPARDPNHELKQEPGWSQLALPIAQAVLVRYREHKAYQAADADALYDCVTIDQGRPQAFSSLKFSTRARYGIWFGLAHPGGLFTDLKILGYKLSYNLKILKSDQIWSEATNAVVPATVTEPLAVLLSLYTEQLPATPKMFQQLVRELRVTSYHHLAIDRPLTAPLAPSLTITLEAVYLPVINGESMPSLVLNGLVRSFTGPICHQILTLPESTEASSADDAGAGAGAGASAGARLEVSASRAPERILEIEPDEQMQTDYWVKLTF
jgi:hypothetical protein